MTTVIYSELDEDIFSEENLKEIRQDLFYEAVSFGEAKEKGWESPEDIPDEVVEAEAKYWYDTGDIWIDTYDNIKDKIDKPFIWRYVVRDMTVYVLTESWDDFYYNIIPDDTYTRVRLSDDDGIFVVDGYCHDGEFCYYGKALTNQGIEYARTHYIPYSDNIRSWRDKKKFSEMDRIFNSTQYSVKPRVKI